VSTNKKATANCNGADRPTIRPHLVLLSGHRRLAQRLIVATDAPLPMAQKMYGIVCTERTQT
jgi:hypothetical protein